MIKIILSGCNGRMGKVISEICKKNPETEIVCGVDINTVMQYGYPVYAALKDVSESADVVIDFSNPATLEDLISFCTQRKLPVVISTTGHDEEQIKKINRAAELIPVFRSGNMSLGINVLTALIQQAAKVLGDCFDVEIIEKHHNQKLDAPSGTALMLADKLSEVLPYEAKYVYDRHSVRQKRDEREIGIHSLRAGTIVGEHEVVFAGHDETITLSHSAQSREVFAAGAVHAAAYLASCKAPGLYNMDNLVKSLI